jgi:hypothetical protein
MRGGIKWPILYHQALIQNSNAKIKARLWAKMFKFLFISEMKSHLNPNQELLTKFCV